MNWRHPVRKPPVTRPQAAVIALVVAALALSSCTTVTRLSEAEVPPKLEGRAAALAEPASGPYTVETGRIEGEHGRPVDYETYRPVEPATRVMVFLAHGFLRDLGSMRGWAALWASHGVPVTVMSLRNSTWTNGHHDRNAADIRLLARTIHHGPVLYAGYSAGGLAAFLAAGADGGPQGRAVAYLGLDAVDSGGLALDARPVLSVPALFLLGEPSSCNARNNILAAVPDRPGVQVVHVRYATHCSFEYPSDSACEALCGRIEPPEAAAHVVARIRSLATAWVLEQIGVVR
jgi:pimeloyl-ACP methyl ester carboxylesterase